MRKIDAEALKKAMEFVTNDPTCPMHIAANIDQIIDCAPTVDDWIPCSERMPEREVNVLIYVSCWKDIPDQVAHMQYDGIMWELSDEEYYFPQEDVTHWMPLPPDPPKEDNEDEPH